MRVALIGCMVMHREISRLVADSPRVVRVWWLRQGLHDTPDILRRTLQTRIDEVERENAALPAPLRFDMIALAYGLCAGGVLGLESRSLPLVVPRCDDCISLFLGSAARYRELFAQAPGAYWYNTGWIEQALTPSKAQYARLRADYEAAYGKENADYLMQCSNAWIREYDRCRFIASPQGDAPACVEYAKRAAADFGWTFEVVQGDPSYLEALVNGPWDDERFLTCPPRSRIEADYSERKVRNAPIA